MLLTIFSYSLLNVSCTRLCKGIVAGSGSVLIGAASMLNPVTSSGLLKF